MNNVDLMIAEILVSVSQAQARRKPTDNHYDLLLILMGLEQQVVASIEDYYRKFYEEFENEKIKATANLVQGETSLPPEILQRANRLGEDSGS